MDYSFLPDIIIGIHLLWILFVIYGFIMTFYVFFFAENKRFLDRWVLRTVHLGGIILTSVLELTGKYCPLTVAENYFSPAGRAYEGAFIAHYIEKIVYPDINPVILIAAAVVVALFTLFVYIIRPPAAVTRFFGRLRGGGK